MHLQISGQDFVVTEQLHTHIETRMLFCLSRFEPKVDSVRVQISEMNPQLDSADIQVFIEVRLVPSGCVSVKNRAPDAIVAIGRVTQRLMHAVSREIDRRRTI